MRTARGEAEELYEGTSLQTRLAEAYERAEELLPEQAVVILASDGGVEAVAADVWKTVKTHLALPESPLAV